MAYVLNVALSALQMMSVLFFFDAFFTRKHKSAMFWIGAAAWIGVSVAVVHLEGAVIGMMKVFLLPILFFAASLLLYNGHVATKLFISAALYAVLNALLFACRFFAMALFRLDYDAYLNSPRLVLCVTALHTLAALVISLCIRYFHRPQNDQRNAWPWILLASLVPITAILALPLLYDTHYEWPHYATPANVSLMLIAAAYIGVIALSDWLQQRAAEHEKLIAVNERARGQQESLAALEAAYAAQRKATHDFGQHIEVLSSLLTAKQYDKAAAYLELLKKQHTERILLVNTHHSAIDAILNQKGLAAEKKGIDIHFEVNDLSALCIDSVDCTVVLGNLLDNAIEACMRLKEAQRWIKVRVVAEADADDKTLFLSIWNASLPVTIDNGEIRTTKENPSLHGFGLYNIISILQKYGAEHVLSYEDGSFLFSCEWPDKAL